jgi:hypothetical protein
MARRVPRAARLGEAPGRVTRVEKLAAGRDETGAAVAEIHAGRCGR